MAKKVKTTRIIPSDLLTLTDSITQVCGAGSLQIGRGSIVNVSTFSSGIPALDDAMGCGGIPRGRLIELFGAESSGKTTTSLHIMASCQQHYFTDKNRNGVTAFIDAEHAFDPQWAEAIGVDMDKLIFSQPDYGEQSFEIARRLAESGLTDLIVVDSVAALIPKTMLDGAVGDQFIGAHARLMSENINRLKGLCSKTKTTVVFINQVREKVGFFMGSPEVTPGGRALKFYASLRMQVSKGSAIKLNEETIVGFRPTVKIVKNKVARPFTKAEYDICCNHPKRPISGVDTIASLIEVAEKYKIITKKSSFYSYNDKNLGNGAVNASNAIRENSELLKELWDKLHGALTTHVPDAIIIEDDDPDDTPDTDDPLIDSDEEPATQLAED